VDAVNVSSAVMTIGEFARRTRLSARALRLYDTQGLLTPAAVDPRTGYRRYTADQVDRARQIALLRSAGMALAEIAEVVDLDGPAADLVIGEWWRRVEARHRARHSLVAYLRTMYLGRSEKVYEVQTRDVPEQKVLTVSRRLSVADLDGFLDEGVAALRDHLKQGGAEPTGPHVVIFHNPVNEDSDGPVEVCQPFTGSVEPSGTLVVRLEPAHTEAYVTVPRKAFDYPEVLQAYDAVEQWLRQHDVRMTAPCREIHLADWRAAGPDDPVADVAFPITTNG